MRRKEEKIQTRISHAPPEAVCVPKDLPLTAFYLFAPEEVQARAAEAKLAIEAHEAFLRAVASGKNHIPRRLRQALDKGYRHNQALVARGEAGQKQLMAILRGEAQPDWRRMQKEADRLLKTYHSPHRQLPYELWLYRQNDRQAQKLLMSGAILAAHYLRGAVEFPRAETNSRKKRRQQQKKAEQAALVPLLYEAIDGLGNERFLQHGP